MAEFTATILAKGAPVATSAGKVTMCAIGLTEEFGLVRLYPLTVGQDVAVRVWSIVAASARRSKKDTRRESWRVESCEPVDAVKDSRRKAEILEQCVLHSGTVDPVNYQNEEQASIAVVRPSGPVGCALVPRPHLQDDEDREDAWVMVQKQHPFKPMLIWNSHQGKEHTTHVLAQEIYMGLQRFASMPFRVFENLRIGDPDYQHWLVLGNMKDRRNVWVCPHVHRLKKTAETMRLSYGIPDGSPAGWPYCRQEEINARDAGRQRRFTFITDGM
jgi:hypothetical protein